MIIILDTNIYRQDLMMKSHKFDILFDYIKKTHSKIVMPEIVHRELIAIYEREISGRLNDYRKAKRNLSGILISTPIPDLEVSIGKEVREYLDHINAKLGIQNEDIFKLKDSYLQDVVERAIKRLRPCSDAGEEFRDALLWCSVIDIGQSSPEESLSFVSANTKQFAGDDGYLHSHLVAEANKMGVKVGYFSSLESFCKEHATKIEYITTKWIVSSFDVDRLNKDILQILDRTGKGLLRDYVRNHNRDSRLDYDADKYLTDYVEPLWTSLDLDEFYVYEMIDGSIRIEASFIGEVEVEYEGKARVKRVALDWESGWSLWRDERDNEFEETHRAYLDSFRDDMYTTRIKYAYPEVKVEVQVIVQEKTVKEWEIAGWEIL